MEHWEPLKPDGYRFVYDDALFRPGTDTFLLSSLPRLKAGLRVCDLGCGTGLLSLLLMQRQGGMCVTGIDVQEAAISLAQRCAAENGLVGQLNFLHGDLRNVKQHFSTGSFDLVVCNPPYYPPQSGRMAEESAIRTARSEVNCTLADICQAAAFLLCWGGSFCLVHKPERLTDVLDALRCWGCEPKRLRMVCTRAESAPSLILVEGRRGGKPGLSIEAPLILQNNDGSPTAETDAIYFRRQEDTP